MKKTRGSLKEEILLILKKENRGFKGENSS